MLTLGLLGVTIFELTLMWLLVATPHVRVDLRARLLLTMGIFQRWRSACNISEFHGWKTGDQKRGMYHRHCSGSQITCKTSLPGTVGRLLRLLLPLPVCVAARPRFWVDLRLVTARSRCACSCGKLDVWRMKINTMSFEKAMAVAGQ